MTPTKKSQVRIEISNLEEDKTVVEGILLTVAGKFNLYDNSHTSRVPETIKSIVEAKGSGFGLGARVVEDFIFVDFNRHAGDLTKFDEVHNFILNQLQKAFHKELKEIWEEDSAYCKSC